MDILFGAAPDTHNQGVTALCHSVCTGLSTRDVAPLTIVDHSGPQRDEVWRLGERTVPVRRIAMTPSRRVWRESSLARIALCVRTGLPSRPARAIKNARSVLDVSAGDSFTDLYGPRRFEAIVRPKELALALGAPLILLPQTIGPFHHAKSRTRAAAVLAGAAAVFTRDERSMERLKDLLGDRFDPARHRTGIDMAVTLPMTRPTRLPAKITRWLEGDRPVAGFNVSGLLANNETAALSRFYLRTGHRAAAEAIARALLVRPDVNLLLVPHVTVADGHPESDHAACKRLEHALSPQFPGRILTVPNGLHAMELKWIIARLDWFAGARMHAAIAGFSSCTPTLGLAYSDKIQGVFNACHIGTEIADLRTMDAAALAQATTVSFARRGALAQELTARHAGLMARAEAQMDAIAAAMAAAG